MDELECPMCGNQMELIDGRAEPYCYACGELSARLSIRYFIPDQPAYQPPPEPLSPAEYEAWLFDLDPDRGHHE